MSVTAEATQTLQRWRTSKPSPCDRTSSTRFDTLPDRNAGLLEDDGRLTAVGRAVGLAAAFWLTRLLRTQLFNVTPSDPATLTGVAAFIAFVALVACYIPASRATRVDPMVVLRDE
ncbi:MAG TPA: hypothetical protein VFT39_02625 [Vicinamibacterales bacterium]|nr:hypothetical protein [Vicinamibacterales bacterium]